MDKTFSAKTCPECEPAEVTTLEDVSKQKRVYICGNYICPVSKDCKTIYEVKFEGVQIPLKSPVN